MPVNRDPQLLRQYHVARSRGDEVAAMDAWEQLTVNNLDRIKQAVRLFRFDGSTSLPPDDRDDAAQEAFIRLMAMGRRGFDSPVLEAYYAALWTCAENTVRDYGRGNLRHEKRQSGSLDATYDGGEGSPYDAAQRAEDERRRAIEDDKEAAEKRAAEDIRQVHWGISQIKNDNHRETMELTYRDKLEVEQIAERLDISVENVYARRSRGTKELKGILRDHRS